MLGAAYGAEANDYRHFVPTNIIACDSFQDNANEITQNFK